MRITKVDQNEAISVVFFSNPAMIWYIGTSDTDSKIWKFFNKNGKIVRTIGNREVGNYGIFSGKEQRFLDGW